MGITNKTSYKRGMNPNSMKNLHPATPGNRLSPGRPKKEDCLLSCIQEELTKKSPNGVQTNEQLIAACLVSMATKGNIKAVELMMAYLHSKPVNKTEISGSGSMIIRVLEDGNDGNS